MKEGKTEEYVKCVIEKEHLMQVFIDQNRDKLLALLDIHSQEDKVYLEVRVKVKMLLTQKTHLNFAAI